MIHPHADWTRAALERLVGMTETLTLEFKSYRALVWDGEKELRKKRITEAAKDVAAMANEQGGTIIYGIEEATEGTRHSAARVEEGFAAADGISREWFVQTIREHVHPPLAELDAVDVDLGGGRMALVVLVPQAMGSARQTDDLQFWRRDAHGVHRMTVQEINDVASRSVRPRLELRLRRTEASLVEPPFMEKPRPQFNARLEFEITNDSSVIADFAVITIALRHGTFAPSGEDDWVHLRSDGDWELRRTVLASGGSRRWSPITPGFLLVAQGFKVEVPAIEGDDDPTRSPRIIGLSRLDHPGGARSYRLELSPMEAGGHGAGRARPLSRVDELDLGLPTRSPAAGIQLRPFPGDLSASSIDELRALAWFLVPPGVG